MASVGSICPRRMSSNLRLFFEHSESSLSYRPPQIIKAAAATFLYIPIAVDGTAHENASAYFLLERGEWVPIEAATWLEDLRRRLPTGLEIRKGVWPDLETMTAEAGLYRSGDDNASPTGGIVRIRLAIRSKHLVIDSLITQKAH